MESELKKLKIARTTTRKEFVKAKENAERTKQEAKLAIQKRKESIAERKKLKEKFDKIRTEITELERK